MRRAGGGGGGAGKVAGPVRELPVRPHHHAEGPPLNEYEQHGWPAVLLARFSG